MRILAVNGGSSSVKCRLEALDRAESEPPEPLWQRSEDSHEGLEALLASAPGPVDAVVHRIVHGGMHRSTAIITPEVRADIEGAAEIAPDHNAFELKAIDASIKVWPNVPQVATFDTSFHVTLAPETYVYAGPYDWFEAGIRRYGFHGLSHQFASRRAMEITGARSIIVCHLGNGASLCAVRDGKSVDTTMGFTPLEGLMMGTRSGSIDPAILVYLTRHRGYSAGDLDRILNKESGLKGVSGVSSDMREVMAAMARGNARAKLAFDIYGHRLCREIGAMAGVLGGADAIVFTGGIGENCAPLRDLVNRRFAFLNAKMLTIHAEEEWEMIRECYLLIGGSR